MWGQCIWFKIWLEGSSGEPGPPRQHSPLEIDQPAVKSAFWNPCKEGSALCVPAPVASVLLSVFRPPPLAGSCWNGRSLFLRLRVPLGQPSSVVACARLRYQIAGTMEETPHPRVSAQRLRLPPASPPRALRQSPSAALRCSA